jgi:DNA-binding FadR family transcriptional regulator
MTRNIAVREISNMLHSVKHCIKFSDDPEKITELEQERQELEPALYRLAAGHKNIEQSSAKIKTLIEYRSAPGNDQKFYRIDYLLKELRAIDELLSEYLQKGAIPKTTEGNQSPKEQNK